MTLVEVIENSKYHRVVYTNGKDLIVMASEGFDDHKYWLVVEGVIVREDMFTNDDVAKEYYQINDRDMTGYYNKVYAEKIAEGKVA